MVAPSCGNVWEWCADWVTADYYLDSPPVNPPGPDMGRQRVMRGGSYPCHHSYCHRYRVGARSSSGPDSSAGNLGSVPSPASLRTDRRISGRTGPASARNGP